MSLSVTPAAIAGATRRSVFFYPERAIRPTTVFRPSTRGVDRGAKTDRVQLRRGIEALELGDDRGDPKNRRGIYS